jgi:hypothetical protein
LLRSPFRDRSIHTACDANSKPTLISDWDDAIGSDATEFIARTKATAAANPTPVNRISTAHPHVTNDVIHRSSSEIENSDVVRKASPIREITEGWEWRLLAKLCGAPASNVPLPGFHGRPRNFNGDSRSQVLNRIDLRHPAACKRSASRIDADQIPEIGISHAWFSRGRKIMSAESTIILFAIALAFALFAITLAWSDARTRDLPKQ